MHFSVNVSGSTVTVLSTGHTLSGQSLFLRFILFKKKVLVSILLLFIRFLLYIASTCHQGAVSRCQKFKHHVFQSFVRLLVLNTFPQFCHPQTYNTHFHKRLFKETAVVKGKNVISPLDSWPLRILYLSHYCVCTHTQFLIVICHKSSAYVLQV